MVESIEIFYYGKRITNSFDLRVVNLTMHTNGPRRHRFHSRKVSRVRGEVLVVPSSFVPGVGFVREDFILVIMTLLLLSKLDQDYCRIWSLVSLRECYSLFLWFVKPMHSPVHDSQQPRIECSCLVLGSVLGSGIETSCEAN